MPFNLKYCVYNIRTIYIVIVIIILVLVIIILLKHAFFCDIYIYMSI